VQSRCTAAEYRPMWAYVFCKSFRIYRRSVLVFFRCHICIFAFFLFLFLMLRVLPNSGRTKPTRTDSAVSDSIRSFRAVAESPGVLSVSAANTILRRFVRDFSRRGFGSGAASSGAYRSPLSDCQRQYGCGAPSCCVWYCCCRAHDLSVKRAAR